MASLQARAHGRLHGRATELGVVEHHIRAVAGGQGTTILLDGVAGAGKHRLVDEALQRARMHRVPGLVTSARHSNQMVMADLRRLLLKQLVADLAERAPRRSLVVAINDLHSADVEYLTAIELLVHQLRDRPVLWLLSGDRERSQPLGRLFRAIEEQVDATRISLGPLSAGAAAMVVSDRLGGVEPAPDLLALARSVGHLPRLLVDLAADLRQARAIEVVDGTAHIVATEPPPWVAGFVGSWVESLSPTARHLTEVVAVLGDSCTVDDAVAVLDGQLGVLLVGLQELLDQGMLEPTGDLVAFPHPLVRRAVHDGIAGPVRRVLHQQIGAALADRGASAATISTDRAHEHAARGLGMGEEGRCNHAVTAARALLGAGRFAEALDLTRACLDDEGAAEGAGELRLMLSYLLVVDLQPGAAVGEAEAALVDPALSEEQYRAAQLARILALVAQGEMTRVRGLVEEILTGTPRQRADAALPEAMTALAHVAWHDGRTSDALGFIRAAIQRFDGAPPPFHAGHGRDALASMLTALGAFSAAATTIRSARQRRDHPHALLWSAAPTLRTARLHLATGRLSAAIAEAHAGLTTAESAGARVLVPPALIVLARARLLRGHLREAEQDLVRCRRELGGLPPRSPASIDCDLMEAQLAETSGDRDRAFELATPVIDGVAASKRVLLDDAAAAAWLVRTALLAGDRPRALHVVAAAEQLAVDNGAFPSLRASAAHARGLLDRAPEMLQRAVREHVRPLARALAAEQAAAVLSDSGQPDAARACLKEALAEYDRAGASGEAARRA